MQKNCLLKKGLSKNVYQKVQDMCWKIYCYLPCFISLILISFYSTAKFFFFISLQLSHKRQSQSRGPAHSTRSESDARSQPTHALQMMNVREI